MPGSSFSTAAAVMDEDVVEAVSSEPQWHVAWTRSNCEQQVHDELVARGFQPFLPRIGRWSRRAGMRYLARVPMFPGYLFLRHAMDKASYLEVCKVKGLVRLLGACWDRLATVPEREIESIRRAIEADRPVLPHAYLREGEQVRVTCGPLAGAEGILLRAEAQAGQLVLSVDLLRRSVVVSVDCTEVVPL